jgi:hypothetical protein
VLGGLIHEYQIAASLSTDGGTLGTKCRRFTAVPERPTRNPTPPGDSASTAARRELPSNPFGWTRHEQDRILGPFRPSRNTGMVRDSQVPD